MELEAHDTQRKNEHKQEMCQPLRLQSKLADTYFASHLTGAHNIVRMKICFM